VKCNQNRAGPRAARPSVRLAMILGILISRLVSLAFGAGRD
jgi:hypothetical protein